MAVPHGASDMVIGHLTGLLDAAGVLAHQGGWDEILMVVGPIVIFALLLRAANRRAASACPAIPRASFRRSARQA